jgi:hypothetical protein
MICIILLYLSYFIVSYRITNKWTDPIVCVYVCFKIKHIRYTYMHTLTGEDLGAVAEGGVVVACVAVGGRGRALVVEGVPDCRILYYIID